MPYLRPNTNNYVGFVPAKIPNGGLQINTYVATTSGTTIFAGDPMVLTSVGTVRSWTSAGAGFQPTFPTSAYCVVGVAAQYIAAYAATTSPPNVLIYDDPNQTFFINNSTSIATVSSDVMGAPVTYLATGVIGSTGGNTLTGRSNIAIGSTSGTGWGHSTQLGLLTSALSGFLTSGVYPLQVIGLHPIEAASGHSAPTGLSSALGNSYKWIVRWNVHMNAGGATLAGNILTSV